MIVGVFGYKMSGKKHLAEKLAERFVLQVVDVDDLLIQLCTAGRDGSRQILNYFGDGFANSTGGVNLKKVFKFVNADVNKMKIFNYLVEPLVANEIQKKIDEFKALKKSGKGDSKGLIVHGFGYDEKVCGKFFDKVIWIEVDKVVLRDRSGVERAREVENSFLLNRKPKDDCLFIENNGGLDDFDKACNMISI